MASAANRHSPLPFHARDSITCVVVAFIETKLVEAIAERAKADAEEHGGTRPDAAGLLECAEHPRSLILGHQTIEVDALGRERLRDVADELARFDLGEIV